MNLSDFFKKIGMPEDDEWGLPSSDKRFPDGAHYRIEISGIERPEVCEAVLDEADKRGVPVHRLISTVMGATLLSKEELKRFAKLCKDYGVEAILTPGPRAFWDTGRQIVTPEGMVCGPRFRSTRWVKYYVEDVLRCCDAGFRGFLVWDEGVLWLMNKLREEGIIPKNTVFKVSIYTGHGTPFSAKVLQDLGANTFNPIGDISLPTLAAIRKVIDIPMDIHVYLFDQWGGFNRFYECAEIARIASPCYFKIEPGVSVSALYKPWVSPEFLAWFAREKVKYAEIIIELIQKQNPDIKCSEKTPQDLAIPEV